MGWKWNFLKSFLFEVRTIKNCWPQGFGKFSLAILDASRLFASNLSVYVEKGLLLSYCLMSEDKISL